MFWLLSNGRLADCESWISEVRSRNKRRAFALGVLFIVVIDDLRDEHEIERETPRLN